MKITRAIAASLFALTLAGGVLNASAQKATPPAPVTATCKVAALNLNTASKADLVKIPSLGPKLADAIIKSRPYKDEAELVKKVKGIGSRNVVQFRPCFLYK